MFAEQRSQSRNQLRRKSSARNGRGLNHAKRFFIGFRQRYAAGRSRCVDGEDEHLYSEIILKSRIPRSRGPQHAILAWWGGKRVREPIARITYTVAKPVAGEMAMLRQQTAGNER